ncbi:unnamed protein product [Xylocopa violacea]|uniref:Uncharacterized protein n=1 Tax=Xylocopa violacea TaxID=135666 RepID=A0ABP1NPU7_XYLVO
MLKFINLYVSVVLLVITGATKNVNKLSPVIVERLKRKSIDDDIEEIAIKEQLFQDIFTEHQEGDKLQFGYVCENPVQWEQRFEEKDLRNNRHRGKVKWGNVDGGYGEHYWDINHK